MRVAPARRWAGRGEFEALRRVRATPDPWEGDGNPLSAELRCRVGGPRGRVGRCLYCARYLSREQHASGQWVFCRWRSQDPAGDLMRSADAVLVVDARMGGPMADSLAAESGEHHLIVVDGQEMLGVACRCDLARVGTGASVFEALRCAPVPIEPGDSLGDAAALMLEHEVGALPVVVAGWMIGLLTREDLAGAGFDEAHFGLACGRPG